MYPSQGGSAYGQQQQYGGQQAYGQMAGYAGNPASQAGGAQHGLAARQVGAGQEVDASGYRGHSMQVPQYGGAYAGVYGSGAMSGGQQAGAGSDKGAVSSSLQGRSGYSSALSDSTKFSSGAIGSSLDVKTNDHISVMNRGFAQNEDQFPLKNSDYASVERREYVDHQGGYIGRELQSDAARRYTDSVALSHQHQLQSELHDRIKHQSMLRQQQILTAQSLHSGSDIRQSDYLAATSAPILPGSQELSSYLGRVDADPRSSSILGGAPYGGQHAASILGGAVRRGVDDLMYAQGSSATAYGVSLPPGRDYGAGRGLHSPSLVSDYQGNALSRGHPGLGASMVDDRKDDRSLFRREMEMKDEERRRELLREREKERDRAERERERERECEREREREHERERERDERERERARERERDRLRERRDRERERDRKRASDSRQERTPSRAARDRGGSKTRTERLPRRVTPRREAVNRPRSPVKEKKKEYICKVSPFRLVEIERDYLSLNKRYPKLFISPDFSKVLFNWPKEKLNLSLHTPVSFEHGFIEVDEKSVESRLVPLGDEPSNNKCATTVWNAKVLLMSGISHDALEELSSEKSSDRRISHVKNILKFAVLRKDHTFMAIGGPWDAIIDGGDPSVDDSSLVNTALRYLKDLTQLDLRNCLRWNRFLEIHYDRVGQDGLFRHKEITVLFLPDLSECLPSLDSWRSQWLAHMKDLASRKKKASERKEAAQGERSHSKTEKSNISEKMVKTEGNIVDDEKKTEETKDVKVQKGKEPLSEDKQIDKKIVADVSSEHKSDGTEANDATSDQAVDTKKPIKRKIVKKKVIGKKAAADTTINKPDEKLDVETEVEKLSKQVAAVQEDVSTANPTSVKTFVRKKIIKRLPAGKLALNEEKSVETSTSDQEKIAGKKTEPEEDKEKKEPDGVATVQDSGVKTIGKKKIIRRVIKRKVSLTGDKNANATVKKDVEKEDDVALIEASKVEEMKDPLDKKDDSKKTTEDTLMLNIYKEKADEKKMKDADKVKDEIKSDTASTDGKGVSKTSLERENGRKEDSGKDDNDGKDRTKDEKQKKSKDGTTSDSKHKSIKDIKEKGILDEPPRHPGLFLQAKQSKDSKFRMRTMSLSLDGLLDYNDKDVEEPTFELALFAESLNEMLQYEMGCRILSFLEKLRKRFIIQRNLRKRQRDENSEKDGEKQKGPGKRSKFDDGPTIEKESVKSETHDVSDSKNDEKMSEDGTTVKPEDSKVEEKTEDDDIEEEEEDPEEIIEDEDDQEMDDAAISDDGIQEDETAETGGTHPVKPGGTEHNENDKGANEKSSDKSAKLEGKPESVKEEEKPAIVENKDLTKEVAVDKELLQAFRFFDQNQVGYVKVEDLRCIIHNLGKFLPHRDVKEMVQSALFESNSARDNRIFYKKLVRVADLEVPNA